MADKVVELRGVWKIYRLGKVEVPALRGVDLDVYHGESVTIMGPSGSGKTTLLNIIATIDKPSRGRVVVCSVDVTSLPEKKLSRFRLENIGIVFQFYNLLPELNALENVALSLMLLGLPKSRAYSKAMELLERVGLKNRARHRPSELSGGEQQRVAIARALANNPKLILADEPTGNLDLDSKINVLEVFREVNRDNGVTIIIVTHDTLVTKYTQKTLHLIDGILKY